MAVEIDPINEQRVAERRETSGETIIDQLSKTRARALTLMGRLKDEHLQVEIVRSSRRRMPFGRFLHEMNDHDLQHAADLLPLLTTPVRMPDLGD